MNFCQEASNLMISIICLVISIGLVLRIEFLVASRAVRHLCELHVLILVPTGEFSETDAATELYSMRSLKNS